MKKPAKPLALRLYISGRAPNSVRALSNLQALCQRYAVDRYELEVIDVVSQPARAMDDNVLVTPTLLRLRPKPIQTIVGDLSDEDVVVSALGFTAALK